MSAGVRNCNRAKGANVSLGFDRIRIFFLTACASVSNVCWVFSIFAWPEMKCARVAAVAASRFSEDEQKCDDNDVVACFWTLAFC